MKYSTRIESIGPRGVLLLAALLVVVTSLTLLANGEMKAQGGPPELLTAPKLTASTKEGNAVELSWTSVSGAVRYELWTWHGGGWEQLDDGALTGTTYSHTGLSAGTTYYYTVRAVAANGPPGAWSEFVGTTASETLPPTSTATPTVTATPTPTVQVNRPSSLPDGGSSLTRGTGRRRRMAGLLITRGTGRRRLGLLIRGTGRRRLGLLIRGTGRRRLGLLIRGTGRHRLSLCRPGRRR